MITKKGQELLNKTNSSLVSCDLELLSERRAPLLLHRYRPWLDFFLRDGSKRTILQRYRDQVVNLKALNGIDPCKAISVALVYKICTVSNQASPPRFRPMIDGQAKLLHFLKANPKHTKKRSRVSVEITLSCWNGNTRAILLQICPLATVPYFRPSSPLAIL